MSFLKGDDRLIGLARALYSFGRARPGSAESQPRNRQISGACWHGPVSRIRIGVADRQQHKNRFTADIQGLLGERGRDR
jgi:hypothetical protein